MKVLKKNLLSLHFIDKARTKKQAYLNFEVVSLIKCQIEVVVL